MSKIVKALREAVVSARCTHDFQYLKPHPIGNGLSAHCRKCRCRFTAWPGGVHYDELVAAARRSGFDVEQVSPGEKSPV